MTSIRESIETAVRHLAEHPEKARYTDSYARATGGGDLRIEVVGPHDEHLLTDMPKGVGGRGEHPTPGWLFRAAVASCVGSTVAMEAAREGIDLTHLEVEVDSESDDRGIFGMDENTPPRTVLDPHPDPSPGRRGRCRRTADHRRAGGGALSGVRCREAGGSGGGGDRRRLSGHGVDPGRRAAPPRRGWVARPFPRAQASTGRGRLTPIPPRVSAP